MPSVAKVFEAAYSHLQQHALTDALDCGWVQVERGAHLGAHVVQDDAVYKLVRDVFAVVIDSEIVLDRIEVKARCARRWPTLEPF